MLSGQDRKITIKDKYVCHICMKLATDDIHILKMIKLLLTGSLL